jgi:hypothetical protein
MPLGLIAGKLQRDTLDGIQLAQLAAHARPLPGGHLPQCLLEVRRQVIAGARYRLAARHSPGRRQRRHQVGYRLATYAQQFNAGNVGLRCNHTRIACVHATAQPGSCKGAMYSAYASSASGSPVPVSITVRSAGGQARPLRT